MSSRPPCPPRLLHPALHRQGGVALLEALIAALLLAIGLLGTIGLQARAYSALTEAGMRAEATIAAERLVGVMTTDSERLSDYVLASGDNPGARLAPWYAATRKSIPGAKVTVSVAKGTSGGAATVTVAISWQRRAGDPTNTHTVRAYI